MPVLANLWKKKLVKSALCLICFQEAETVEHTFLLCGWTRSVWFGLQIQCSPDRNNISTLHEWMSMKFEEFSRQQDFKDFVISSLCCALWAIWKERNLVVFEKTQPNPTATVAMANILHIDYFSFWKSTNQGSDPCNMDLGANCIWRPPPMGMLKLNSDSCFNQSRNTAHAGIIIRDEKGEVYTGLTKFFPASSPLLTEALSLREAMIFAESLGIQRLIVESDCLELIKACREDIKRGEIFGLIKDILSIKNKFQQIGFTWISRKGNQVAHQIALLASQKALPANWIRNYPCSLSSLIQKEIRVRSYNCCEEGTRGNHFIGLTEVQIEPDITSNSVLSRSGYPFDPGWNEELGESSQIRTGHQRT